MKKWLLLVGILVPALASGSLPQANYNLTGQGARALGMGGAFIGIADDATAISWNPAGLAQLDRPEVSAVVKFESQTSGWDPKTVSLSGIQFTTSDQSNSHVVLNFASVVFPLKLKDRNLALAVAYQQQVDFFNRPDSNYTVTGGANTISPGLAYQITPHFALGAAANIWMGSTNLNYKSSTLNFSGKEPYSGLNFFIGGWGHLKPFKFGAVVRTPLTIKYHDEFSGTLGLLPPRVPSDDKSNQLKVPFMLGFGAAVEPTQNITVSADVDFRPYSKTEYDDSTGAKDTTMSKDIQDITQLSLGAEYLLMLRPGIVPLRVGFHTDPRTYTGHKVDASWNDLSDGKQVSGTVISFGTGFVSKKFQLDGAYEFGSTKDPYSFDPSLPVNPSTINWKESSSRLLVSGIVRF